MAALLGGGFVVPEKLRKPTALASANYYDQIAIRAQDGIVEINNADCFHWQDHVSAPTRRTTRRTSRTCRRKPKKENR